MEYQIYIQDEDGKFVAEVFVNETSHQILKADSYEVKLFIHEKESEE